MNTYKGIEYEVFGNGFTVFFEGDEFYFETEEEAEERIIAGFLGA